MNCNRIFSNFEHAVQSCTSSILAGVGSGLQAAAAVKQYEEMAEVWLAVPCFYCHVWCVPVSRVFVTQSLHQTPLLCQTFGPLHVESRHCLFFYPQGWGWNANPFHFVPFLNFFSHKFTKFVLLEFFVFLLHYPPCGFSLKMVSNSKNLCFGQILPHETKISINCLWYRDFFGRKFHVPLLQTSSFFVILSLPVHPKCITSNFCSLRFFLFFFCTFFQIRIV